MEIISKLLVATYSVLLPILIGGIGKLIKDSKANREKHEAANKEIIKWMKSTDEKMDKLETKIDESDMKDARYRIIRFDDEEGRGITHSADHWVQILDDIDTYKSYCESHPAYKNHRGQGAMKRIVKEDESRKGMNRRCSKIV